MLDQPQGSVRFATSMAGAGFGNCLTAMSRAKRACLSNLEDMMYVGCVDKIK